MNLGNPHRPAVDYKYIYIYNIKKNKQGYVKVPPRIKKAFTTWFELDKTNVLTIVLGGGPTCDHKKTQEERVLPVGGVQTTEWGGWTLGWTRDALTTPAEDLKGFEWCKMQEWERRLAAAAGSHGEWINIILILWNLGSFLCQLFITILLTCFASFIFDKTK